ncbi:Protein PET100 homolog, mitochondrial [Lemmus lemmus]
MSLYLTFPVVMFWISNQAEWFEDYVVQRKRELWPPEKEAQVSSAFFFQEAGSPYPGWTWNKFHHQP